MLAGGYGSLRMDNNGCLRMVKKKKNAPINIDNGWLLLVLMLVN